MITISRAKYSTEYPASFMLVASMNPCPCGYYGHPTKKCVCNEYQRTHYMSKISGPLLDRIDLQIEVQPVDFDQLLCKLSAMPNSFEHCRGAANRSRRQMSSKAPGEPSAAIRQRVIAARMLQERRFKDEPGIHCNAQMTPSLLHKYAEPNAAGLEKLKDAMERMNMSARAYDRILKVARTIADLEGTADVLDHHSRGAHQPTATSTAPPTSAPHYKYRIMPDQERNIIIYRTADGRASVALYAHDGKIWVNQQQMAELFATSKQIISYHIVNILKENELTQDSVVKEFLTTAADGKSYNVVFYSLEMIIAVGYRVRGVRGTQFRQWATEHLTEYLVKGFTMDDERLKNPDGRPDYFDELLARIRDIRASEKRFYQKIRDLFKLSSDYDKTDKATQMFFAETQNKLLYAVTHQTAAELICARADAEKPNMGERLHCPQRRYYHCQKLPARCRNRQIEPPR